MQNQQKFAENIPSPWISFHFGFNFLLIPITNSLSTMKILNPNIKQVIFLRISKWWRYYERISILHFKPKQALILPNEMLFVFCPGRALSRAELVPPPLPSTTSSSIAHRQSSLHSIMQTVNMKTNSGMYS